ncbi:MAG TPA: carbohydrate kinase [Baekduia sp.]|uniref:carbohydrate kinase family protein n=1 Tax=Baekduia sp. TaxID=2600305 RepID=UPI002C998746|nr:carbohydrate kinase [Baekduia sp.]HMJ37772.1 carbohydrate kinase [Baekduia sp.]
MSDQGRTLVAGEALFDLWLEGGEVRGRPGGGPFNTARTLGRLRRPVAYLGAVSDDGFGRTLRQHLADDGVAPDAIVETALPSTLALADLGAAGGARYGFWGDGTASASLRPDAALAAIPDGVDVLHVGTLGLVFEPMAEALEAVTARLAPRALVVLDPNVRPAAITHEQGYRDRLDRVLALTTIVKVSDEDLAWLCPGQAAEDAARGLLARGPAVVLLTRGADGVVVMTAAGERVVDVPPARVVDTIGAGDAFSGGFLAASRLRSGGMDLDAAADAAAYGALVASMTCERAGASPPTLDEVEARRRAGGVPAA